jgi:hypothetical protein
LLEKATDCSILVRTDWFIEKSGKDGIALTGKMHIVGALTRV